MSCLSLYLILGAIGLSVALIASGCATPATTIHRTAIAQAPSPAVTTAPDDDAVRRDAEEELGPEVAADLPPIVTEPPKPRDGGADALVNELVERLGERERSEDGVTRICISKIRNQSRAQPVEFNAFLERFAETLSRSGRELDIAFIAARDEQPIQYDILGTAYLITAEGFDIWELFITITPVDTAWTVWRPTSPVHVLRQPRPGQQQIFFAR